MPIFETSPISAKSNEFIVNLYSYELTIFHLKELTAEESDTDIIEKTNCWERCKGLYINAISFALNKAETASTFKEKTDFRDWLIKSKVSITRNIIQLINLHPTDDDDVFKTMSSTLYAIINAWLGRIEILEANNPFQKIASFKEEPARKEMDQVKTALDLKGNRKPVLIQQYSRHFYSYIGSLERSLLTEELSLEVYDEVWLNNHYQSMKQLTGIDKAELGVNWGKLQNTIALMRNKPTSIDQVNASVNLIVAWEKKTKLEKIIEQFMEAIIQTVEWIKTQKENMPSILKRVGVFLLEVLGGGVGLILAPAVLPVLGISAKLTGSEKLNSAFDWYLRGIKSTKSMIGLVFIIGLAAGIVIPVIHPHVISSIGAYVAVAGPALMVCGAGSYGVVDYLKEKKGLEAKGQHRIQMHEYYRDRDTDMVKSRFDAQDRERTERSERRDSDEENLIEQLLANRKKSKRPETNPPEKEAKAASAAGASAAASFGYRPTYTAYTSAASQSPDALQIVTSSTKNVRRQS